jgi:hypothetical protein
VACRLEIRRGRRSVKDLVIKADCCHSTASNTVLLNCRIMAEAGGKTVPRGFGVEAGRLRTPRCWGTSEIYPRARTVGLGRSTGNELDPASSNSPSALPIATAPQERARCHGMSRRMSIGHARRRFTSPSDLCNHATAETKRSQLVGGEHWQDLVL